MSTIKPMLAGKLEDLSQVKYPVVASPKLDGIRCLTINNIPVSRKLKPIPNNYIREKLKDLPDGIFDGELMTYYDAPIHDMKDFNHIQGDVMREEGEPNFKFVVFDMVLDTPYVDRLKHLEALLRRARNVEIIKSVMITNEKELLEYEKECTDFGYEGVMIRDANGPYKFGRSTVNEGYLLKLKRFLDDEAVVIGFEERMHNANEAKKDNLGRTERSHKKEGMVPADTLGALNVKWNDKVFSIGTGFDDALRQFVWDNKEKFNGQFVTFKYQELSQYGIPRFPVFKGFRSSDDR